MKGKERQRYNLHEILKKRSYDHALLATYTFEPRFFEDFCLEKFKSLHSNGNITIFLDRGVYDHAVQSASSTPLKANLRYFLHPIAVPGVFHPKVFLFLKKNRGLLILGSANFTRPGLTSNAELVGCYEYEVGKKESTLNLFQSVYGFFKELAEKYPAKTLFSNLNTIEREVPWLFNDCTIKEDINPILLSNITSPLWGQITKNISSPVKHFYILSRFFDSNPIILNKIEDDLSPAALTIFTENKITTMTPNWLDHPLIKSAKAQIKLCTYYDNEHHQPLHSKAIAIEQENGDIHFAFGSANFTSPALMKAAHEGNAETLLYLKNMPSNIFEPSSFFDPEDSAVTIKNKDQLKTAAREEEKFPLDKHEIYLAEAILEEEKLILSIFNCEDLECASLRADISISGRFPAHYPIKEPEEGFYIVSLEKSQIRQMEHHSAVVQVIFEDKDGNELKSNTILISNLQDVQTGENLRQKRRAKEAQQSAIQFVNILNDLVSFGDVNSLKTFLTYCDIPIDNITRPALGRGSKDHWVCGQGMRNLGDRNIRHFLSLHEAVVNFVQRHIRKLEKHTNDGALEGVPNYMHIFLSICGLLQNQTERVFHGFETSSSSLTADDWYRCRKQIDVYYNHFKNIMDSLGNRYLKNLQQHYAMKDIKDKFEPDYKYLKESFEQILELRDKIENLRKSKLKISTIYGSLVKAKYGDNIFKTEKWNDYSRVMTATFKEIKLKIAA